MPQNTHSTTLSSAHVQVRPTSVPGILSVSKLIAAPTRGPAKLSADYKKSAKAPTEGDEGEGREEEEAIDAKKPRVLAIKVIRMKMYIYIYL